MINQDEQLRYYLTQTLRKRIDATVLQLKISKIDLALRKDKLLASILTTFNDMLKGYGQAFCIKNDDIFLVYSNQVKEGSIKACLIKVWMNFSSDKQTDKASELLEKKYFLPQDQDNLAYEITRIGNTEPPKRVGPETKEKKPFVLPTSDEPEKKLFTPEMLTRVTKALQNTDFSNMIRRQSICIILEDSDPQHLYEEVYVSTADLGESVLPGVSLEGTPWLFQALTETLDMRVLSSVSRHDDGAFKKNFSLNLNVSTILSEAFRSFDENIHSTEKSSIMIELQPIDIFSDLNSYLMARDFAQNTGYKVCIDGVTVKTLKYINRERLGADYVKIVWSEDLPYAFKESPELEEAFVSMGANRIILSHVDVQEGLEFSKKYGITLFQGPYIQSLLSGNARHRSPMRERRRF